MPMSLASTYFEAEDVLVMLIYTKPFEALTPICFDIFQQRTLRMPRSLQKAVMFGLTLQGPGLKRLNPTEAYRVNAFYDRRWLSSGPAGRPTLRF